MIHVEDLSKYYQDLCAVDHINLDIHKGEILALLGPNGAGKTTTLRMLTGFLKPTSGTIRVKDYSIEDNALEIKKLLGYLPESAPLYHEMLVYDYLDFVADVRELRGADKVTRIRHLAELCGLKEVMHRPIGELSKGYKQRVGLAHAMMNDPEILILDEPTSGLDPNQIIEIRDIIKAIGTEKTVILSTHILSEAEATCDRVIIINRGRIAADSSTENLKESRGDEYLVHLSLAHADLDSAKKELSSVPGIVAVNQNSTVVEEDADHVLRLTLTCRSAEDIRGRIYEAVKQTDWILLELYQETKSLENIFREVTRES
jgi:ABC-2 type transport system ATP-binding protein